MVPSSNFVENTVDRRTFYVKYIKQILLWLKKYNKLIACSLAFVFLFITITIVTMETLQNFSSSTQTSTTSQSTRISTIKPPVIVEEYEKTRDDSSYCTLRDTGSCSIECSKVYDANISSIVNKLDISACGSPKIKLTLTNVNFANDTIKKGWLKDLVPRPVTLTISSSTLTELEEGAFSGELFEILEELAIENTEIKVLKSATFLDSRIQSLSVRQCPSGNLYAEFNALEHIANTLTILQFNQCIDQFEAIRNITGTSVSIFNKLIEIDISYNFFTTVVNNSFVDTPQLRSLYLLSNNIESIEVNAFNEIGNSLQLLHLNKNKLTTLTEGVFDGFKYEGKIYIEDNRWNCNCDLVWFKKFYIDNISKYFQNGNITFMCTQGNYSDVDFCPGSSTDSTTISTESTSTTTESTPVTENPNNLISLNCTDITYFQDLSLEGLNRIYSHTIQVRNGTITYHMYQIEGTPNFEIKVANNLGTDYMIWINSKNSSDYGCVNNIQDVVILDNLHYGSTYTICLLKENADMVTPFDCTSLTVPLEWKNSPWIINKYIAAVIGGVVGVTLILIIATAIIVFYTIRQNPKMIKGNKRVVIVRNKSADALVMPNYDKQRYAPPSVYTNSEGYLTPRNKMYEKINERRFRSLNTITEKFYQDFPGTVPRLSKSSYAEFLHRRSVGSEVYEPPPLPPNHPSEKPSCSRQSTVYKH